ncbi:MAG: glycosyltransferase family 4 protein [Clostridiales bacterium]|nr:glycosyltransferase family 4 protein [Clostridiales bacterium]
MKVLYIVSTLRSTGPTNQLYGIIHNLDREKFTPYILTLSKEAKDSEKQKFEDDNVKVETLGLSRIALIFVGKIKLKKALKRITPDLIHTSGLRADIVMSKIRINIPLCSTIRNYVYEDYILQYGKIKGILISLWHENAIKKMKNPICCSKALQDKYIKHLNKKVFAIQNGVDIQHYYVKSLEERLKIRQDLKLPINKKIIIVVGSLINRKDPMAIINAVGKFPKKEDFQLIFIGDGILWEELQKYKSEYIKFLGNKNNVFEYLQAADFFISASKSEGLPNSVLEAGACGLPMILSDIPQHREIFEADIMGIEYFNTGDINMLAEKIQKYLDDYEKYSRAVISGYIKERFDSRVMSRNYQKFYEHIYGE